MGRTEKFWDKIAERYAKRPIGDEAAYQKKLQVTRKYLRPDSEVLEFGCGTGSTAILHAPFVKHILATDLSTKMLEIARKNSAAEKITNVDFEQSTIDAFNASSRSFDALLCLSVLHLLADREQAMAKIHKLLKPGGMFISSTACIGDTMKFFKYIAPVGKFLGLMPMVSVFTRDELLTSIAETGFEIEYEWRPGKGKAVFVVAKRKDLK